MCKALNNVVQQVETFDVETFQDPSTSQHIPILVAWTESSRTRVKFIFSGEDLLQTIINNFRRGVNYYAHNLIFDASFILEAMSRQHIKYRWVFVNYRLFGITIETTGGYIFLKCSQKLLPVPLKKLYKTLSPTAKIDFDYSEIDYLNRWDRASLVKALGDKTRREMFKKLIKYCKNDAIMLREALVAFWESVNRLTQKPVDKTSIYSAGGLALKIFQKNNPLKLNLKFSATQFRAIYPAYRGGRCEIFGNEFNPNRKILHFDFPGMYQSCLKGSFPGGNLIFKNQPTNFNKPGFYYITAEVRADIPILPVFKNKLLFPVGTVTGLFWYEEIQLANQHKQLTKTVIHYGWLVDQYKPYYEQFANKLDDERAEGLTQKHVTKLISNAFYGRLGLNKTLSITYRCERGWAEEGEYAYIGDVILKNKDVAQKNFKADIAGAAIITARARIKLFNALLYTQNELGGKLLYCDTDSIIASFPISANIENTRWNDYTLFDTSKDDTKIAKAVFVAPKTYGVTFHPDKCKIHLKGGSSDDITFEELKQAFLKSLPLKITKRTITRSNDFKYTTQSSTIIINTDNYDKRIWTKNKTSTVPLKI